MLRLENRSPFLSQEYLKLIACVTMLFDHIGATVVKTLYIRLASTGIFSTELYHLYHLLRTVGRLAFPIYCFLLVEGAHYTRNSRKYALRLAVTALLAELPFDLAFNSGAFWSGQSVMITLLLGFLTLQAMQKASHPLLKLLVALPFALLAQWMSTDYGADGIWVIVLFALTRDTKHSIALQAFGLWFIFSPNHLMMFNWLAGFEVTTQELAVLALIPISLYSGEKKSGSKALQWAFYLFYPVHLTVLWLIQEVIHV